jgi:DNA-binding PadR family transcriptional regulator
MRDRKDWMNKAVDPILELLDEEMVLNAQSIYLTLQQRAESKDDAPGRTTVYRAIESLEENQYIESPNQNASYYYITDIGRSYLQDEPDPDE